MQSKLSLLRSALLVLFMATGGPVACGKKAAPVGFLEAGNKLFAAGDFEKAKNEYLKALEKEPANAAAIKQLGLIWSEQGAPLMAAPYLIQAVKAAPGDPELRKKLASVYLSLGDKKSAWREATAALDAAPADGEALLALADSAVEPADWQEFRKRVQQFPNRNSAAWQIARVPLFLLDRDSYSARDAVDRALAIDPKSYSAHATAAKLAREEKDRFGLEQSLKAAAELAPVRSIPRLDYCKHLMANGKEIQALTLLSEITAAAPDYLPAWHDTATADLIGKRYDAALEALGKIFAIDPENFVGRILQAEILIQKGDPRAAIASLQTLAANERYARAPSLAHAMGRAHKQNGEPEKAAPLLEQALGAYPNNVSLRMDLADTCLSRKRPEKAIEVLEGFVAAAGRDKQQIPVKAAYFLALAYQMKGELEAAVKLMKQVIDQSPPTAELYMYLGRMEIQAANPAAAKAAYEQAVKLEPDNLTVLGSLVDLELQMKDIDSAMSRVQAVAAKKPDSAEASFLLGKVHFARSSWQEAETELQKATSLNPKAAGPAQLLVETIRRSGNVQKALERLEGILRSQPGNVQALQAAAGIYEEEKQYDKAREKYERLIAEMPGNITAINNLALLFAGPLNDLKKASTYAEQARKLLPVTDAASAPEQKQQAASVKDTCSYVHYLQNQYTEAYALGREAAGEFASHPEVQYHFGLAAAAMGYLSEAREPLTMAAGAKNDFPGRADAQKRLELINNAAKISVSDIDSLAKAQPKDVFLQALLAGALERDGDQNRAAAEYAKVLELNPQHLPAALHQAKILARSGGDKTKALAIARERRAAVEDHPALAGILGGIFYETGAYVEARQVLLAVTRVSTGNPSDWRYLGLATYSQGDVPRAREEMKKAQDGLQATPADPLQAAVTTFMKLTEPRAAASPLPKELVDLADSALKTDQGYVPALMIRAEDQFSRGDARSGEATLDTVFATYPNFAPALKMRAAHAAAAGQDVDKALDMARKARRVLSSDADLARILATLSYQKQDYPNAVMYFEEAARESADVMDAKSLCLQGLAYIQAGTPEKARKPLEDATRAGLSGDLATSAQEALKKLDAK